MIAAYAKLTGAVSAASLHAALEDALPSYRRKHLAMNVAMLEAGDRAVQALEAPAWGTA